MESDLNPDDWTVLFNASGTYLVRVSKFLTTEDHHEAPTAVYASEAYSLQTQFMPTPNGGMQRAVLCAPLLACTQSPSTLIFNLQGGGYVNLSAMNDGDRAEHIAFIRNARSMAADMHAQRGNMPSNAGADLDPIERIRRQHGKRLKGDG